MIKFNLFFINNLYENYYKLNCKYKLYFFQDYKIIILKFIINYNSNPI